MKIKLYGAFMLAIAAFSAIESNAQTNRALSNLTSPTAINESLLPVVSNSKDLGSINLGWKDLYISNRLYVKGSLSMHSPGSGNFFVGGGAGNISLSSTNNTGTGYYTLANLTTGYSNSATGAFALNSNTTGSNNTAFGTSALINNTTGISNTAIGSSTMNDNTAGVYNTAVGYYSLFSNTTGKLNTALGSNVLISNTTGYENTASGYFTLYSNIDGFDNTASGAFALYSNTSGYRNVGSGTYALQHNSTGYSNTATGYAALESNTKGFFNTAIGMGANVSTGSLTYATAIGAGAVVDASYKVRIGNNFVNSIGGQVGWTTFSDGRFKRNITEDVAGLAFINSLRPVSYTIDTKSLNRYYHKEQPEEKPEASLKAVADKAEEEAGKIVHDGFVAQEVEEAANKLGFRFSGVDRPGTDDGLYGLRYDNFVVPLVKAVQELSKMYDSLKKQSDAQEKEIKKLMSMMQSVTETNSSAISTGKITLSDASLQHNVPNPFNKTTTITYTLPQQFTTAQILISDMNGKMLKQVNVSGKGNGTLQVDATAFSPGTYNYSLIVDGKLVSTRQMLFGK